MQKNLLLQNISQKYKYSHSYEENFAEQEYLPEKLSKTKLYEPQNNSAEEKIAQVIKKRWGKKYE